MSTLSRHPYLAVALLGVVVVLAALFVPLPGQGDDDSAGGSGFVPKPLVDVEGGRPDAAASMAPAAEQAPATLDGVVRRPFSMKGSPRSSAPGRAARPHVVRLSVTSSEPIGTVGYLVPTSRDRSYGRAKDVGRAWSITTRAYGEPDYAQIFAQAGASGAPVTCTITVDGKVTAKRSSSGAWGQLFCQG